MKKVRQIMISAALLCNLSAVLWMPAAQKIDMVSASDSKNVISGAENGSTWTFDSVGKVITIEGTGFISIREDSSWVKYLSEAEQIVFGDGIVEIEAYIDYNDTSVAKVVLGKDVKSCNFLAAEEYEVDAGNKNLAVYDGALYTKDWKELLHMPYRKEIGRYPKQLRIIGEYAYTNRQANILIIPQGVTTIREPGFGGSLSAEYVLFPDTVTDFEIDHGFRCPSGYYFWEGKNEALEEAAKVYNRPERDLHYEIKGFWESIGYRRISDLCKGTESGKITGLYNLGLYSFYFGDDGRPISGWKQIDGKWHYFFENGIMCTGVCDIQESYTDQLGSDLCYAFDKDGALMTNTTYFGPYDQKYAVDEMGVATYIPPDSTGKNGLVTEEGKTYYSLDGQRWRGLHYIDGKAYYFDNDGVMQYSKWVQVENSWYYLNDYGAGVVNCWRLKDGKYRYLGADGKMKTNSLIKDYGSWYYVQADGTRYESTWAFLGERYWYWFGGSGKMAVDQWLKLDGKWYHFNDFGAMEASKWVKSGKYWYYLGSNGAMVTNKWVKSGQYWYYLGSDGAMLTNTLTPDGYKVDKLGRWI